MTRQIFSRFKTYEQQSKKGSIDQQYLGAETNHSLADG
jgi:hypothetical protein